jgi:hypothetical protein
LHRRRSWALAAVLLISGAACGSTVEVEARDTGLTRIKRAVELAEASHSYRVHGVLGVSSPAVEWKGFVVGTDEEYVIKAAGLLIDSRRLNGVHWARRLEPLETWLTAPAGAPIDPGVLLRGVEQRAEHRGGQWRITLHFDQVDVLAALSHIPSTGPTTADVALDDDALVEVTLHLGGNAHADISFGDYGANLTIDPVDAPTTLLER